MRQLVQVFTKAPRPGHVKTRLIPALGAVGACRLYRQLLHRWLRTLAPAYPVQLWCAPDPNHPRLQSYARRYGLDLRTQADGDLGQRMAAALTAGLAHADCVLLTGGDCPSLDVAYLEQAFAALRQGRQVVLGPAEDGGYVLVGVRGAVPQGLFDGVAWSTSQVMAQTRQRLRAAGVDWAELGLQWDLDRPQDLPRWYALGHGHGIQARQVLCPDKSGDRGL